MPEFKNPNHPVQPKKGVYAWKCKKNSRLQTLYVGNAGNKNTILPKGTLLRGVLEAQMGGALSTDKGRSLDTDFIVGAAINIFENYGWKCFWEHISDDPNREVDICQKLKPILQNLKNGKILQKYRNKSEKERWKTSEKNKNEAIELIQRELKYDL